MTSVAIEDLIVRCENDTSHQLVLDHWAQLCLDTLNGEGVSAGELGLTFIEKEQIEQLNVEYMSKTGPTDVLAFPLDSEADLTADVPLLLGDVLLCPDIASSQSVDHDWSFEEEISLLIIHGTLHILGHDHVETSETEKMRAREAFHMNRLGYEHKVWHD